MIAPSVSMKLLSEPKLEFGYRQRLEDPRNGLFLFGPISDKRTPSQIRAGVIGTPRGVTLYKKWVETTGTFIPASSANSQHQFPFSGFEAAFRARWPALPVVEIAVSPTEISNTIRLSDRYKAIYQTVTLFEKPIRHVLRDDDAQVDVWFVVIPDEVWRYGRPMSRISRDKVIYSGPTLGQKVARRLFHEPSLFQEEMDAAEIYRYELNFHHQLKARMIRTRAVIQVIRESSLNFDEDEEFSGRRMQDAATRAWNLCTTAFFKAGGRPWKLAQAREGVCYVGLVFKQNSVDQAGGNACCGAQLFLDSGDGLVFKGAMGPWYSAGTGEFHLREAEARKLMQRVVQSYIEEHRKEPSELFVHGRTRFSDAEWSGFSSAVPSTTNLVGVRIVRSQDMKLFRPGTTPVLRGSTYRLSKSRALLWTSGFVHQLSTYTGREVPNPLLVDICRGSAELDVVLADVMGLTKVNFNACLFADGLPVTLRFANAVGEILTAAPFTEGPPLPFRHYI
jgi:hypothetical protein